MGHDFKAIEPDSKPSFNREINDSKMWFASDYYSTFKRNSLNGLQNIDVSRKC